MNTEELEDKVTILYESEKDTDIEEILMILSDDVLESSQSEVLYAYKAASLFYFNQEELAIHYAQLAINVDPQFAFPYLIKADIFYSKSDYNKALGNYTDATTLQSNYKEAQSGKAATLFYLNRYEEAVVAFNKVLELDNKDAEGFRRRGHTYWKLNDSSKAIQDINKSIALGDTNANLGHNLKGGIYHSQGLYEKALIEYDQAIAFDDNYYAPFYNKGLTLLKLGKIEDSIEMFTKALKIKSLYARAFRARGKAYEKLERYEEAITDYKKYIELTSDKTNFLSQVSEQRITELRKKIENIWYDEIDKLVIEIKNLLQYNNTFVTHFTSLSSAKKLILDNSKFRLSEGNFLNDTSEGRELFNYIPFSHLKKINEDTLAEVFTVRPFIGSFVADSKHDDLTLWRMYGKEAEEEAKGCAITIFREQFIKNLETSIEFEEDGVTLSEKDKNFTFYHVAYRTKDKFIVPGNSTSRNTKLNKLMENLRAKVTSLDDLKKDSITKIMNDIAYLFKSSEYQYENEVRLVVQGVGFKKNITTVGNFPRVFIELVSVVPVLSKITLGPKVQRADEWAAAFHYQIEATPMNSKAVEIILSHIPFK